MKRKIEQEKMSLDQYIEKNTVKAYNVKNAKDTVAILTLTVGVVVAAALFFVVLKLFELHEVAGYLGIAASVILFIIFYLVPCIRLNKMNAFQVRNIKYSNYRKALKHNKEVRNELAQMIIDLTANTEDTTWYTESKVGKLAIAKQSGKSNEVREILLDIYRTDIRKAANKIITDHAVKVGITTALSQSEALDTAFVSLFELEMIKEIIFLYGFRPTDFELAKIYKTVIINSLVSYGTQNAATSLIGKISVATSQSSIIGSIVGTLAACATQGFLNGALTVVIGFQTKKYLMKEYNLAETLEDLELTEEDLSAEEAILKEVKSEVEKSTLNSKKAI